MKLFCAFSVENILLYHQDILSLKESKIHVKGWMKIFYDINVFLKDRLSPGAPVMLNALSNNPDGCGYDTVVAQPTHQQTLWTPLKYTPNATNSHHQQPSLNHYPLWPKLASQNVNLRCHSPVQSSPVACITDTVKSKVALSTTPVLTSPSPTSLLSRTPHAPLSPFPLRCTRYLKG